MASRQEIAITIKGNLSANGGGKKEEISYSRGSSQAVSNDDSANKEMGKYAEIGGKGKNGFSVAGSMLTVYAFNQVKNRIIQTASTMWNRYVDMKEDYLAQNNMNVIKAHVGAVSSYATSASAGYAMGGVIGAAIGVVGNAVNRAVSYKTTRANYNEQNNAMNAQTNFSRVRMGLIDGGRGTDN